MVKRVRLSTAYLIRIEDFNHALTLPDISNMFSGPGPDLEM
jgi:hypothetical protein